MSTTERARRMVGKSRRSRISSRRKNSAHAPYDVPKRQWIKSPGVIHRQTDWDESPRYTGKRGPARRSASLSPGVTPGRRRGCVPSVAHRLSMTIRLPALARATASVLDHDFDMRRQGRRRPRCWVGQRSRPARSDCLNCMVEHRRQSCPHGTGHRCFEDRGLRRRPCRRP